MRETRIHPEGLSGGERTALVLLKPLVGMAAWVRYPVNALYPFVRVYTILTAHSQATRKAGVLGFLTHGVVLNILAVNLISDKSAWQWIPAIGAFAFGVLLLLAMIGASIESWDWDEGDIDRMFGRDR